MTYRDRRAARAERLRGWAGTRVARANAQLTSQPELRSDHAFNTQPGIIPERTRMNRRDHAAFVSLDKAESMLARAANIEAAAERAIYSDDEDAVVKLRAKIEGLEAERARIVAYNKTARAAGKTGANHGDLSLLTADQVADLESSIRYTPYNVGKGGTFPAYHLSNLGGLISKSRQRLAYLERSAG
jgi:hypothetical protein